MREIKFRAWDEEEKRMWYQDNLPVGYDGDIHRWEATLNVNYFEVTEEIHDGRSWQHPIRFYTNNMDLVMQYTGLKDKNGVEIYEGDIVKTKLGISKVEEQAGAYYVFVPNRELLGAAVYTFGVEVIGNIQENPELLNQ